MSDQSFTPIVAEISLMPAAATSKLAVRVYNRSPGMIGVQIRGKRANTEMYAHASITLLQARELIAHLEAALADA